MSMKMPSAYLLRSSGSVTLGGWKRGRQSTLGLLTSLNPLTGCFQVHTSIVLHFLLPHPWTLMYQLLPKWAVY